MLSKEDKLKRVYKKVLNLKKSPLYIERIENNAHPVIGEGDSNADVMFIGEAPGKNEAKTGKPFCGASGRVLDELLEYINLDRKKVYVTNIVKDRPTDNRDPKSEEIEIYGPFLDEQINIIQPKVIATLGRFSMEYIMNKFGLSEELDVISKMHGKTFKVKTDYGFVQIIPLYHPAVAIYNRTKLPELKKDFKNLKKFL